MKKTTTLLLLILLLIVSCSLKDNKEFVDGSKIEIEQYDSLTVENLATLCKVWGFLKYYHPEVAKGKYNWDYELFRIIPAIINPETVQKRNTILYEWIDKLGEIKLTKNTRLIDSTNIKLYPDTEWIEDESSLGKVSQQLIEIKNAQRTGENYYVELTPSIGNPIFTNEQDYSQFEYPVPVIAYLPYFVTGT